MKCTDDRLAVPCAVDEINRMRLLWTVETWDHVSGIADHGPTLCCASGLVLLVCACVYVCALGFMCVCVCPFSALLVSGLALSVQDQFSQALHSNTDSS